MKTRQSQLKLFIQFLGLLYLTGNTVEAASSRGSFGGIASESASTEVSASANTQPQFQIPAWPSTDSKGFFAITDYANRDGKKEGSSAVSKLAGGNSRSDLPHSQSWISKNAQAGVNPVAGSEVILKGALEAHESWPAPPYFVQLETFSIQPGSLGAPSLQAIQSFEFQIPDADLQAGIWQSPKNLKISDFKESTNLVFRAELKTPNQVIASDEAIFVIDKSTDANSESLAEISPVSSTVVLHSNSLFKTDILCREQGRLFISFRASNGDSHSNTLACHQNAEFRTPLEFDLADLDVRPGDSLQLEVIFVDVALNRSPRLSAEIIRRTPQVEISEPTAPLLNLSGDVRVAGTCSEPKHPVDVSLGQAFERLNCNSNGRFSGILLKNDIGNQYSNIPLEARHFHSTEYQQNGQFAGFDSVLVSTQEAAQNLLDILDTALDKIAERRVQVGAAMNRLDIAESFSQRSYENLEQAKSNILDTDIATETAELVRHQILQQAQLSVLTQSNLNSQMILRLLDSIVSP